jgi:hypothetical protein
MCYTDLVARNYLATVCEASLALLIKATVVRSYLFNDTVSTAEGYFVFNTVSERLHLFFFLVAPTLGSLLQLLEHRAEFPQNDYIKRQ